MGWRGATGTTAATLFPQYTERHMAWMAFWAKLTLRQVGWSGNVLVAHSAPYVPAARRALPVSTAGRHASPANLGQHCYADAGR